jgi:hypothetical protein
VNVWRELSDDPRALQRAAHDDELGDAHTEWDADPRRWDTCSCRECADERGRDAAEMEAMSTVERPCCPSCGGVVTSLEPASFGQMLVRCDFCSARYIATSADLRTIELRKVEP